MRLTPRRAQASRELLTDGLSTSPGGGEKPVRPPGGPSVPAPITLANVGVTADELSPTQFTLQLSRPSVPAGRVRIELRNAGEDPHNLRVRREGGLLPLLSFADLMPDGLERQTTTLAHGRYVLWCALDGHEALGMHTTLEVQ